MLCRKIKQGKDIRVIGGLLFCIRWSGKPSVTRWRLTSDLPAFRKSGERILGRRSSSECKGPETDDVRWSGVARGQAGGVREERREVWIMVPRAGCVRVRLSLLSDV